MKKYYALGNYSKESFGGFVQNPDQDRKAVAEKLMSSIGSKLLCFDFLRGEYDFIASAEANSFEEIAGLKMALQATCAGNLIILESINMNEIAKNAAKAVGSYSPPAKT